MAYPEPKVGDVVLCRVQFSSGGDSVRPGVVTKVYPKSDDGVSSVEIVLGSSRVGRQFPGDILIAPYVDAKEFASSGLSKPSRFKTDTIFRLAYDSRNFPVPANKRHGESPKIGRLPRSALARMVDAYRTLIQQQRLQCPSS